MKLLYSSFFLICFSLCSANFLQAQVDIGKKEEHKIHRICETYFRQHDKVLSDYDAPTDSLRSITSAPLFNFLLARRDFFRLMEYENIRFPKVNIIRIETSDSIGCIIDSDPSIKLNVKRKEAGWIVTGYDNHEIDQGDILRFDSIYKEESKVLAVKDSIEEIIRNFVEGVSQMRQSQDTDLLKANCTEACYKYLLKRAEYDRIRGNKPRRSTLKKMERAQVFEDSADCRINIKGMGWGRINLLFKEGTWLVAGENGDFWTDQDAKDIEEDITTYKELIKFNDRIELFNERFKTFFETGDSSPLHEIATEKLIEQLEIYRRLAGTVDTSYLQIYGMSPSYSPESYYAIYGDSAYYNEIYDSIRWIKQNGQWVFDELFCNIHIEDKFDKAHQTFYDFRKLMTISYSIYNTSDNIYTTPPVPVTPLAPGEKEVLKTSHNHRLDRSSKNLVYKSGIEQLYSDIKSETAKVADEVSYEGIIYVEFDIDNLGSKSNIHALDNVGSLEAQLAEEIVRRLGAWQHKKKDRPSVTNMVIAIEF